MAKTKKPKPVEVPEDLTRSALPGGHTAFWYTDDELPIRRNRKLEVYKISLVPRLVELALAQGIVDRETGQIDQTASVIPGVPAGLTLEEAEQMIEMGETTAWAYLKDWTLRLPDGSGRRPLPEDPDDLQDLPNDVYRALTEHAAKITSSQIDFTAENGGDRFSIDAAMNQAQNPAAEEANLPTGA